MNTVTHPLEPVWNSDSRILILGTMPSPASRNAEFYYMHPQNRFWKVMAAVFGEKMAYTNKGTRSGGISAEIDLAAAIKERRELLLRHNIALWDVLASCDINGAADSSIKNAIPNDFTEIFENSEIRWVFCTGKTAFSLWQKYCAPHYEISCDCLPSTSPANAAWSLEKLTLAYDVLRKTALFTVSESI